MSALSGSDIVWPETGVQAQHDRGVPSRGTWRFEARKEHRYRIRIEQGVYVECVDPCDDPVIRDLPDEDTVVVCECARPIEEPSIDISLDVTATLRFEMLCTGGHYEYACDCGWQFIAENVEEVKT